MKNDIRWKTIRWKMALDEKWLDETRTHHLMISFMIFYLYYRTDPNTKTIPIPVLVLGLGSEYWYWYWNSPGIGIGGIGVRDQYQYHLTKSPTTNGIFF